MHIATLLPLLQTPESTGDMILGYVVMGLVGLGYVISLVLRQRGLKHDLDVIETLQRDED
jgi:hypothetical protein